MWEFLWSRLILLCATTFAERCSQRRKAWESKCLFIHFFAFVCTGIQAVCGIQRKMSNVFTLSFFIIFPWDRVFSGPANPATPKSHPLTWWPLPHSPGVARGDFVTAIVLCCVCVCVFYIWIKFLMFAQHVIPLNPDLFWPTTTTTGSLFQITQGSQGL